MLKPNSAPQINQGDIVLINFSPTKGHEQHGLRPALVISSNNYGYLMESLIIVMPISNTENKFPTHVPLLTQHGDVTGVVLTQQVRTFDAINRKVKVIGKATPEIVAHCKEMYRSFV